MLVVGGISGGWLWWVVAVGVRADGLVVLVATVVLGCNSRCWHKVLLDSVPSLTHPSSLKR